MKLEYKIELEIPDEYPAQWIEEQKKYYKTIYKNTDITQIISDISISTAIGNDIEDTITNYVDCVSNVKVSELV